LEALWIVTQYSRGGEGAAPSREWLAALEEIERRMPEFSPIRRAAGKQARKVAGAIDVGAYEFVKETE